MGGASGTCALAPCRRWGALKESVEGCWAGCWAPTTTSENCIELPANTSNAIYQRMRADMQKIANRHRADGQAEAEAIQAGADAKVTVVLATARSNGEKIKAVGQANAAKIYADAFSKNQEFFTLYRSLSAYEESFNSKNSMLVLDQSSAFFDYFKQGLTRKRNGVSGHGG